MDFTLTKNARTLEGHIVLYHADGELRLPNQGKQDQVSRLSNWRQLLKVGRQIEVYHYKDKPIQAQMKLRPEDERKWDSEPTEDLEWVVFWTALHRVFVEHRAEKKATKDAGRATDEAED